MKIFNLKETRPYSLKQDVDEPKTVFFLGGLDSKLHSYLSNNLLDNETHRILAGSMVRETVKFGVKGWEHFFNTDGSEVIFDEKIHTQSWGTPQGPYKGLTDTALNFFPWPAMQELFNVIMESNTLSEQDSKNSDSPSQ